MVLVGVVLTPGQATAGGPQVITVVLVGIAKSE